MAKKKRQPPRKSPKAGPGKAPKRTRSKPEPPAGLPDRRALEGIMRNLVGGLSDDSPAPDTPLARAQEVVDRGFAHQADPAVRQLRHSHTHPSRRESGIADRELMNRVAFPESNLKS